MTAIEAKRIFVVDDDQQICELLDQYLTRNHYRVTTATSGEDFLDQFASDPNYDLVVLDIMMGGIDGFEVCRGLRQEGILVPVIMLTASSDEADRIIGLELGADDYLAKPFNPRELLARIRAISRRIDPARQVTSGRYLRFAGFEMDTTCRELFDYDHQKVAITAADYNLLLFFLQKQGEVLSREAIAEKTRGRDSTPLDRFVDMHVSRLRQLLGEDARNSRIIKTVRGRGYILSSPVEKADEPQQ